MTATNPQLLGIIAATPLEGRIFSTVIPPNAPYVLRVSGMGTDNAHHAADELIHKGVTRLLSFGFAGAVNPRVNAGTIILPDTVVTQDKKSFDLSSDWRDAITNRLQHAVALETGTLLEVDTIAMTRQDKARLFDLFSVDYVDMESSATAAVAVQAEIPFLVLRAISDEANDTLPMFVKHTGQGWLKTTVSLIKHPGDLRFLPKLIHNYHRGRSTLTRALKLTGVCLFADNQR